MSTPENYGYTAEHEWVSIDGDIATIGITQYAADQLGDVVYVELPESGRELTAGAVVGEIESTKSVGELFAPMDGTVEASNDDVVSDPSLVNSAPYDAGWLIKVRFSTAPTLLSADDYAALIAQ